MPKEKKLKGYMRRSPKLREIQGNYSSGSPQSQSSEPLRDPLNVTIVDVEEFNDETENFDFRHSRATSSVDPDPLPLSIPPITCPPSSHPPGDFIFNMEELRKILVDCSQRLQNGGQMEVTTLDQSPQSMSRINPGISNKSRK